MATDAETDLPVGLETATWSHEAKAGRAKRVGRRQDDATMIYSITVDGTGRPFEGEVPLE